MRLNYRISPRALKDIDEIWLYTLKKWSRDQADKYYNLILDEIEGLSQNLHSGQSREYIKSGYRSSLVKYHIIFYTISEEDVLEVIRVLHQSKDLETALND